MPRSSIRWRLTALYGTLFLLGGIVLLVVAYGSVRYGFQKQHGASAERVVRTYGYPRSVVNGFYATKAPVSPLRPQTKTLGDVVDGIQSDIRSELLNEMVTRAGIVLGTLVLLSLAVGWMAAGRVLRPVGQITMRARRLSEDNLHDRLALVGPPDELKNLADTIDGLLDRLEAAFDAQRRFSATVSHELRSPLSVLQAEAELMELAPDATPRERVLAGRVAIETRRSEALLGSLLALARAESTLQDQTTLDLADLTGDVLAELAGPATQNGVTLDANLVSASVTGDRWLLERLVRNLLDNAIGHNQPGGWVTATVRATPEGATLEVANGGDVLSTEEVQGILEPFGRADTSRPGHGLGMTVVRSIVDAHHGSLAVVGRPEGGLEVTVRLPAR